MKKQTLIEFGGESYFRDLKLIKSLYLSEVLKDHIEYIHRFNNDSNHHFEIKFKLNVNKKNEK